MAFQKATKRAARARVALIGPSGSGKTFSALRIARGLAGATGRIALADSERGSASKYADRFDFDADNLETFSPRDYIRVIQEAEAAGYDVLIIDSLSHAWMGKGGALEMVDAAAKQSKSRNSFDAWRSVTPEHNAMVDAILRARLHVIVTLRVKTEYVVEEVNGKKTPRKVGLAPVQRDGLEYEFDVVADLDGAELVVTKTRCPELAKAVIAEPGEKLGETLRAWLTDGAVQPVQATREARPAGPHSALGYSAPIPADHASALVANGGDFIGYGKWSGLRLGEATVEQVRECVDAMRAELGSDKPVHNAPQLRATQTALAKWLMEKMATPLREPEVTFGKLKGREISSLSDHELSAVHDQGAEHAQSPGAPKQPWFTALTRCMADVEAEVSRRERAKQAQQTTREPGSEG
jgi:KaiC/GvpD/RAD55 family RecA-like ATPase